MKKQLLRGAILVVVLLFGNSFSNGDGAGDGAGNAVAQADETLERAIDWLVAQQSESGAFKSKHYGAMKQGAATTSLALYSLSMTQSDFTETQRAAIDKAFEFLLQGTKARGRVANPDGSLDHPVYSTAMLLVAAKKFQYDLDAKLVATLHDFLVRSQCIEGRGFKPGNPNYGGWDVIGPDVMPEKTSGTNVSVTRFVLQAFKCWEADPKMEAAKAVAKRVSESQQKAKDWLKRLQQQSADGGFYFTAQPGSALNKATNKQGQVVAYATATCDGCLAMHSISDSDRIGEGFAKAELWIKNNATPEKVFGFEEGDESGAGWSKALHFYHLQALAKVASTVVGPGDWVEKMQANISQRLANAQKDDGRFENGSSLMRENDPLIATAFAIIALSSNRQ